MTYNIDLVLTYNKLDDDINDLCYQAQFLQLFNLTVYNQETIRYNIENIFNELKENNDIKELLKNIKTKLINETKLSIIMDKFTDIDIFYYLFSYDYLHLFHKQYSNYKNNKTYNFLSIV